MDTHLRIPARRRPGILFGALAGAIQSFNPLHFDGDWTRANTDFPNRIAHGVMTAALMSKPLAQLCELKPVIIGDIITATVTLAEKFDEK